MKFICTQENLHQGLQKVQGITAHATTLPILNNVLLQVRNGTLMLKATDLEIALTTNVRGKAEKDGEITVESRILNNFVALLPQDKIALSVEGKSLTVKGGAHKTKINGIASDDFPVIPEIVKKKGFKINGEIFKHALMQVSPAISPDDTRPEINGMYTKVEGNDLTIAGTDSYRLAEKKLSFEEKSSYSGSVIVPLKTIKEVIRTSESEDAMEIYITDNQILFSYDATELVSRLIEGQYPHYEQIIPSSFQTSFTIPRQDFVNAVKISGIFASAGSNNVTFEIKPGKGLAILSSASMGEEQTNIALDIDGEKELKIVFDYRYLLDGLNSIDDEIVHFFANTESSPALLAPSSEKKKFKYILMPIRQ